MDETTRLDGVFDADRITGSTPPESGAAGNNVVGRPPAKKSSPADRESSDSAEHEREPFTPREAMEEGGSFDGVAPVNP